MASAAPPRHSNPRHTVQSPADSDHSIMPIAKHHPDADEGPGLGVVQRLRSPGAHAPILQRSGRPAAGFVYNPPDDDGDYSRRFGLTSPWAVELAIAVLALLSGFALMPLLIFYAGVGDARPL